MKQQQQQQQQQQNNNNDNNDCNSLRQDKELRISSTSNLNIELRTTLTIRTEPNRTNRVKVHPRWLKIQGINHWQRSTDTNWKSEAQRTMNERQYDVKGQSIETQQRDTTSDP